MAEKPKRARDKSSSDDQPRKRQRAEKDVTILNHLQDAGLVDFLWEKVGDLEPVDGCSCLRSSKLSLDPKGYPKNLRLGRKGIRQGNFTPAMAGMHCFTKEDFQWSATGLVLVRDGRRAPGPKWEASHTCNHPWCLNKDHLLWEIPQSNYKRKNCVTQTECPKCQHSFSPCVHDPPCLPCGILNCKSINQHRNLCEDDQIPS